MSTEFIIPPDGDKPPWYQPVPKKMELFSQRPIRASSIAYDHEAPKGRDRTYSPQARRSDVRGLIRDFERRKIHASAAASGSPLAVHAIERVDQLAAASDLSKPLGTSISTSSVDTCLPLSIRTTTLSGSSTTCRETTARISERSSPSNSGWPRKPRSCARSICNRSRA